MSKDVYKRQDQNRAHRAGRAGDLVGRAGQQADDQAADDGRDQTGGGRGPGRDAKSQRQRQGDRGHGQTGHQVLLETSDVIAREFVTVQLGEAAARHERSILGGGNKHRRPDYGRSEAFGNF